MSEELEILYRIRLKLLAALEADYDQGPMPDYDLDDQQFEWGTYRAGLLKELAEVDKAIQRRGRVKVEWLGKDREEDFTE